MKTASPVTQGALLTWGLIAVACGNPDASATDPGGSAAAAGNTFVPTTPSGANGGGGGTQTVVSPPVNAGAGGNSSVGTPGGAGGAAAGGNGAGGQPAAGGNAAGGGQGVGGGASLPVDASSGCGKVPPPGGSAASPLTLGANRYYVKIPPSYDPAKPYPLLFVFHPSNNPISWAENSSGFEEAGARDAAIIVYPGSAGTGWRASDVAMFDPLYQQIAESYCVDRARVFAAGESSGGDYTSILGCEFGDKLTAIGPCATKPVAEYPLEVGKRNCKEHVSAVIIHGVRDNVVGTENGPLTRDFYRTLNECAAASASVQGYTDKLSNCVKFDGCTGQRATFWCEHDDPTYGNTNHGWPKFAGKMLWEHFSSF